MVRFIFVTGGVVSSLGKGLATASLGACLGSAGFRVRLRKLDPYLNVDPGTMNPNQHGEVFVTDDGAEVDLDLGHYERFTGVDACAMDCVTTGKIYQTVIQKERRGDYLGSTVQVIPHVTDAIKSFITHETEGYDFVICEIGGTVGDIESLPFLEAVRQLRNDFGFSQTLFVHVALVPYIAASGESKTKPAQHSVKELQHAGIQPDILLCRCDRPLDADLRRKLALFCNLLPHRVIEAKDVSTIYQVPLTYHQAGLDTQVRSFFHLEHARKPDLSEWYKLVDGILNPRLALTIAVVGKYVSLTDAYKSLNEALIHAGVFHQASVAVQWIDAAVFEGDLGTEKLKEMLLNVDGVIVPGGFGSRGIEGKIKAVRFARENHIPFLGICLGMQLAVIEAARHLAGLPFAHSTEFSDAQGDGNPPVVGLLTQWMRAEEIREYHKNQDLGGTMRLGSYPCQIRPDTKAYAVYGEPLIFERHRHRYEVNTYYQGILEKVGLCFSGLSPEGKLPEIVEQTNHPWFMGVQFHPELKSRPFKPHPLFVAFLQAALNRKKS